MREMKFADGKPFAGSAVLPNACPIIAGLDRPGTGPKPVTGPADRAHIIGSVAYATAADIDAAARFAQRAQPGWDRMGGARRAIVLRTVADMLEGRADDLGGLFASEAGVALSAGADAVREAAEACRHYAGLATRFGDPEILAGPVGETNSLTLHGRGVFACISPSDGQLVIFIGQIVAALAAGNAVLAKPGRQASLVAARVIRLIHQAGLDPELLALLPGEGATVGSALCAHPNVQGVAFTGNAETARSINIGLAARAGPIIPLIVESGKAIGPYALVRFAHERAISVNITAQGGDPTLLNL